MRPKLLLPCRAATTLALTLCGLPCFSQEYVLAPGVVRHPYSAAPAPPPAAPFGELEQVAVDIARRTLLAFHPHISKHPIRTAEVWVRPEGDAVHTYARLIWYTKRLGAEHYESEVFASLVYTPDVRRIFDISYKDNYWIPFRDCNRTAGIVAQINEEFERRDPLRMPYPLVGPRLDQLAPRKPRWIWNPLGGDQPWHVSIADDQVRPRWFPTLSRPVAP